MSAAAARHRRCCLRITLTHTPAALRHAASSADAARYAPFIVYAERGHISRYAMMPDTIMTRLLISPACRLLQRCRFF